MSVQQQYTSKQTTSALLWSSSGQILIQLITLLGGVVLARLLVPQDYGVFAASSLFVTLASMFAGSGVQTIILREDTPTKPFLSAMSGMNLLIASILILAILAGRNQLALLAGVPQVSKTLPLHVLVILFTAYATVPQALLVRHMAQREIAKAGIVSILGYVFVALSLAFSGAGYWSFIFASVTQAGVSTLLMSRANKTWFLPHFSSEVLRKEISFGMQLGLNNVLVWASGLVDNLLTGRLLGATALGYYVFGYNLARMPQRNVLRSITSVTEALIAESVRQQRNVWGRYIRLLRYLTLAVFFVQSILFVITPYLIPFVYGAKWQPAVAAMQIITLGTMVITLSSISHQVYSVMGRPRIWTFILIIRMTLIFILVPLLSTYGIEGIAWAVVIAFLISVLLDQFQLYRLLDGTFTGIIHAVTPATLCTLATVGIGMIMSLTIMPSLPGNFTRLLLAGIMSTLTYATVFALFFPKDRRQFFNYARPYVARLKRHLLRQRFSGKHEA